MVNNPGRSDRGAHPRHEDNQIFVLVGQLLEATKAASEGLKALSQEMRQQAAVTMTTAKTLEMVERTTIELNRIVRTGNATRSLVHMTAEHASAIERLSESQRELRASFREFNQQLDGLGIARARAIGVATFLKLVAIVGFQIITLGVAIYAARK